MIALLKAVVVPFVGAREMPESLSPPSNPEDSWRKSDMEMFVMDDWHRFPGVGLGYKRPMKWATAMAFSSLFQGIEGDMREVRYPFLLIHDPKDKCCAFKGSQTLMELAASEDKSLVE